MLYLCFVHIAVKILITLFHAREILLRNLIDNPDCFKHTLNSKCERYHSKKTYMFSSVLGLLLYLRSTYFASMNPPYGSKL